MSARSLRIIGLCVFLSGCAYLSKFSKKSTESNYPGPDPEMVRLLDSYRDSLNHEMGQKIATVKDTLRFEKPEGALSDIVSDALRFRAARELRKFVHVGVIDANPFKLYFLPGELTLGDVYEFFPYDNHLVVLTLDGNTLLELIGQVAAKGGAPISGVRFRINEDGTPGDVLVNAEVIDLERTYLVATSSWLVDGNEPFPALEKAETRTDLSLSIRDLYIDYFRNQAELYANKDGRIRR